MLTARSSTFRGEPLLLLLLLWTRVTVMNRCSSIGDRLWFRDPTIATVTKSGFDKKELFFFLMNNDDCSSRRPTLVAWIMETSPRNNSDTSTVLALVPASSSRDDNGTAMRDEDKPFTLVLKFGNTYSTLSWEGYSCEQAKRM